MPQHQEHCLGGHYGALQQRREIDMPDFNGAVARVDSKIAGHAQRPVTVAIGDGIEQRIIAGALIVDPGTIVVQ